MPTHIIHYDQGRAAGPFNIYLSGSDGLSIYGTNITRAQLEAGYTVTFADGIPSSSVLIDNLQYSCTTEQLIPFASATPSVSVSPSVTPSLTATPSVTPSITPSITISPSVTPSVTPPPSISISATPSITPSKSPGASLSPTPTPSITSTPSATPSRAASISYFGSATQYDADYLACTQQSCGTQYYSPSSTLVSGSIIYTDYNLSSPLNGNDKWIALSKNCTGPFYSFQINGSGGITAGPYTCTPIVPPIPVGDPAYPMNGISFPYIAAGILTAVSSVNNGNTATEAGFVWSTTTDGNLPNTTSNKSVYGASSGGFYKTISVSGSNYWRAYCIISGNTYYYPTPGSLGQNITN